MTELYPVFFAAAVFIVLSGLEILFFKYLNRRWWNFRPVRIGSFVLPACGLIGIVVWVAGVFAYKKTIMYMGATFTALVLILILALLLTLPISGIINFMHDFIEKRKKTPPAAGTKAPAMPRRRFLKTAAAAVPAVAMSSGLSGIAHAFTDVNVNRIEITLPNLPPALEGFRILHISDIHIGYYVHLGDLERVLERAKAFEPDILLATGDLSDRVDVYPDLLKLLDQFAAPLGAFASIGNHEYFRGIRQVRQAFDDGSVPLLLNSGTTLTWKGQGVYLGGADDPRFMHGRTGAFMKETTAAAMGGAPADAFRILLSHRPNAFDFAADNGVDLTLSGHTHGGQIGLAGRSVFEPWLTEAYLWGQYQKGSSRLYTSSGIGHWFPFRLGCPAEAPVLELRRG